MDPPHNVPREKPTSRTRLLIYALAGMIEPDPRRVMHWFRNDPIAELDNRTAMELVNTGAANQVIRFLKDIAEDARST
ncbi:hypothetical protein [Dyella koreensis]|uniref:DUF2384 domain-containing protein n=1 Tax=Dyella koreensis TaxID=311235 RepID=A0ABW8KBW0_9GAMM